MFTIYVYVLDTLADWEIGYVTSELNSGRFFKKDANRVSLKTVSYSKESIKTMGGMRIVPDCVIDDIVLSETSVLLLPGADTWNNLEHKAIIEKASELLALNATVAAICGATVALANHGLLDNRPHTSNGAGFLEMFSSSYKGQNSYINELSVGDNNLITASSAGALLWAKQIIAHLDVFESNTLESWYAYFNTGDPKDFYALMESLPTNNEN
ncbi:glutamine amidotransferase [Listeria monocytogenes]|uniref:type 1 glutamine amidotransferase family protein n=1 Tax=Listeria monocytogenes TaxID=1639 RepID=UPI00086CABD0|nr:type 1 glutamine amidotransferase family protein [Listeria monocytogenes]EAD8612427.1 glutamine amidotransferase [Listeria monocytogenes]EAD9207177.1 glutamine amidotransferase [Listeria monocytogenes]EAE1342168.1 glutamine amidotransferase [Listeria monocytogenes]EAF4362536.1 glutamine amidotransferase [Listeria monocytogenes]EAG6774935.1 glutamine amidotransferase [Listeria monocytogenes]